MAEYTRDRFILNGELINTAHFEQRFNPPATYVYEVFRAAEGKALFLEDHLERFYHTAGLAAIDPGIDAGALTVLIYLLINNNPEGEGNIKIAMYRDVEQQLQVFIYYTPHVYPTQKQYTEGVDTELLSAERNNPNAKVMDTVLRKSTDQMKEDLEIYEVLLVDRNGFVTEGSRSNLFFIKDGVLITPPADTVLEGITRKQIISLAKENHIPLVEEKVRAVEIDRYDALFISGTSRRVLPVKRVNAMKFQVSDPLIRKLQQLFEEKVAEYLKKA